MPKAGRIKRIKNPDDGNQWIPLRIVDELSMKTGSGPIYNVYKTTLLNDAPPADRKVHTKTVTHLAKNADGTPAVGDSDNPNEKVDIEIIEAFSRKTGSGPTYNKHTFFFNTNEDTNDRKTHTVRVHGTAEGSSSSAWLDVKRTDELKVKTGSGATYNKHIYEFDWNDAEFDTTDVPVDQGDPDENFDPPWRLDPLQEIVNVRWSPPWELVLGVTIKMISIVYTAVVCTPDEDPGSVNDPFMESWHYVPQKSVEWKRVEPQPNPLAISFNTESPDIGDVSDVSIIGFPSCNMLESLGRDDKVGAGLAVVSGAGPFFLSRGARGAAEIDGAPPATQGYVKASAVTIFAHGDTYTGGTACLQGGAVFVVCGTTTGALLNLPAHPHESDIFNGPMNFGSRYAEKSIDFSGMSINASVNGGPVQNYKFTAIAYQGGNTGTSGTFNPPDDGVTGANATAWKNFREDETVDEDDCGELRFSLIFRLDPTQPL